MDKIFAAVSQFCLNRFRSSTTGSPAFRFPDISKHGLVGVPAHVDIEVHSDCALLRLWRRDGLHVDGLLQRFLDSHRFALILVL